MIGSLGLPELLMIFVVALIVFGPRRLPEIGRTLGKALGEFRKATDELKHTIEREVRVEELRQTPTSIVPVETVSRAEPRPAEPPPPSAAPVPEAPPPAAAVPPSQAEG